MDRSVPVTRTGKLREGWRRFKSDGKPGDFAVLKADAFGGAIRGEVEDKLAPFRGLPPAIDLEGLSALPSGTFGKAYANFMTAHHLKPFQVSADLEAIARRNVFAVRYATTHDMFHVLLGFDTTWAGEMGVLAFAATQRYSRHLSIGLGVATILYPVLSPMTVRAILSAKRQGIQMGRQAVFLLGQPLEQEWETPLTTLRIRYRLTDAS